MPVYLDHNATTPPLPEVIEAMSAAMRETWANPSSVHRAGQAARRAVERARGAVAGLIGASPGEVVFTSGATESINLAIRGALASAERGKRTVITSPIEHEAVRELLGMLSRRGEITVRTLSVGPSGVIDPAEVLALLDSSVALVNVMWVNNETGAIQPVREVGAICREHGAIFHVDATQAAGKLTMNPGSGEPDLARWCDLLSISAHKFHGPKGVGSLWVRPGVRLTPQLPGVQERERRAGTENVPAIVGMGVASQAAYAWLRTPENTAKTAARRDRLERGIVERVSAFGGATIIAADAPRVANTTSIAFPKLEAEALLLLLSERGVFASAGAACSSGSLDPSPVLLAMGIPAELAHGTLRFSLSRHTTDAEIDEALSVIPACVERLRSSATSVR